ncbi:MAG: hypothetical protein JWN64_64 [Parcubacteria group bacterium]|nr:hypothetical protein [Parcubacteria group bacterium]
MAQAHTKIDAGLKAVVIAAAGCESALMRKAAFQQAQRMEKSVYIGVVILQALEREESNDCKVEGLIALGFQGVLSERVHALLSKLMISHEHSGKIAVAAINAFLALRGEAAHAISAVTMVLSSDCEADYQYGAKNAAMNTLVNMGERGNPAAPVLAQYILNENEREENRSMACYVLRDIKATPEQVSVSLAKCLLMKEASVVSSALDVLERIGVSKEALPHLMKALEYEDPVTGRVRNRTPGIFGMGTSDMHEFACNLLGSLGKDAKEAIPMLEELLTRSTDFPGNHPHSPPYAYRGQGRPRKVPEAPPPPPSLRFTSERAKEAARKALVAIRG